jgi:hypothetical protein
MSFTPVRGGLLQRKCACGGTPGLSGECEACRKQTLRRATNRQSILNPEPVAPPIVHEVLRSPGQPLDAATRAFMEPRFGHDFSNVRVHNNSRAVDSARAVHARAYTVGQNVVFGSGQYAPRTSGGQKLLAHELAHTVQQCHGTESISSGEISLEPRDSVHEKEAESTSQSLGITPPQRTVARCLQRRTWDTLPVYEERPEITAPKVERVEVNVQPVSIANDDGKNPTAVPSFASAKAIWGKCCVTLKIAGTKTVSKTSFRVLDEDPATDTFTPTVEEKDLMNAAGSGGGSISIIVPETFKNGANVSKNIDGGGVTYMPNRANATCFLVEGSDPTNVAHELGHAMGNGSHNPATVMAGSGAFDKPNLDKVSAAVCGNVKKFAFGKASGKSDCTITTP